METSKILGTLFILLGGAGLIYGLFALFSGNLYALAWVAAIAGLIFFISGVGLLKSAARGEGES